MPTYLSLSVSLCLSQIKFIDCTTGTIVQLPGQPVGKGLSYKSAKELGLLEFTPVATGIIDAHCGCIG